MTYVPPSPCDTLREKRAQYLREAARLDADASGFYDSAAVAKGEAKAMWCAAVHLESAIQALEGPDAPLDPPPKTNTNTNQ